MSDPTGPNDPKREFGGRDLVKLWSGGGLAEHWGGPANAPTVDELLEQHAVSMLAKVYALGVDLYDPELCRSVFAEDAVAVMDDGERVPIDVHLSMIHEAAATFGSTQHVIGQQFVRIDGDEAVMWSYGLGIRDRRVVSGQQYRDRCRRDDRGWLITERRIHIHWLEPSPT